MDEFNTKDLSADMQHKLMKLSTPVDLVKPGIAKHKWYTIDGLKNTKQLKIFSKMFDVIIKIIDDESFFHSFDQGVDLPLDVVIERGLENIIFLANQKKHEFPGNEWQFMVMTYNILRYTDMIVKYSDDEELVKEFPEFYRQYGLRKTSLYEAMLYYERTEKLLKAKKPIWFRYLDGTRLKKVKVYTKGEARVKLF